MDRPIYSFLGDFSDGKDPSRPASLIMALDDFEQDTLTFTYPASMPSLPIATQDDHLEPFLTIPALGGTNSPIRCAMPLARCTTSRFASWLAGLNEFDPSNGSVLSKKALVHRKEYHGRVFTLSEIKAVVAKFGIPDNRWKVDPAMKYDKFIEVQVWDDTPIKEFLAAG